MHTSQQATPAPDAARRQRRLLPSRRGRLVCDGKVDFTVFIEFCKRLLRAADTPVYLVVDGPTVDGYPLDSAHENLGA